MLREFGALLWTILANHKVKSQRVFSVAGNIVTPKRASMNPVKVEQLITVKCNMQLLSRVNLESTCRLFDFVDTVLEFELH